MTAGAPAVLGAAGFTSSGVAGGSFAAAAQVFAGFWTLDVFADMLLDVFTKGVHR